MSKRSVKDHASVCKFLNLRRLQVLLTVTTEPVRTDGIDRYQKNIGLERRTFYSKTKAKEGKDRSENPRQKSCLQFFFR